MRHGSSKFASFSAVCKFRKPQAFVIYLSKTERVVHDGIDNVVYDKKCIKSVNVSYSLTSYKRDTVTQSKKSVILVYSIVSVFWVWEQTYQQMSASPSPLCSSVEYFLQTTQSHLDL